MPSHQFLHDVFFNLLYWRPRQRLLGEIDTQPVFGERVRGLLCGLLGLLDPWGEGGDELLGHEDDFELASVEVVADDDLVTVALDGLARFGQEEVLVGFQLERHDIAAGRPFVE